MVGDMPVLQQKKEEMLAKYVSEVARHEQVVRERELQVRYLPSAVLVVLATHT